MQALASSTSDVTMDFDLLGPNGLTALQFSEELSGPQIELFKSASGCKPIQVCGAVIRRAEGGSVIGLYRKATDAEPAVTISFSIDIHSEVVLNNLDSDYNKSNVHIKVHDSKGTKGSFEKVDISKPFPQFLVLTGGNA